MIKRRKSKYDTFLENISSFGRTKETLAEDCECSTASIQGYVVRAREDGVILAMIKRKKKPTEIVVTNMKRVYELTGYKVARKMARKK